MGLPSSSLGLVTSESTPVPSKERSITKTQTPSERITAEVTSWPGVEAGLGSRGEFGFQVGSHRLGHLHGDHAAHFGFPRDVGAELREQGRVGPHPVNPHSTKMAARRIEPRRTCAT